MIHCFIISENKDFVLATKAFISNNTYNKPICIDLKNRGYSDAIQLFQYLAAEFNSIPTSDLRESIVIVDEYFDYENSKPIDINNNCDNFYAKLILGYPELEFVFLNATVNRTRSILDYLENEKTKKNNAFASIFDNTGLRNSIRNNIKVTLPAKKEGAQEIEEKILIDRKERARIIEDETSYAYFHGYIAYKRNHLCQLFTSIDHLNLERDYLLELYNKLINEDKKSPLLEKNFLQEHLIALYNNDKNKSLQVNLQVQDLSLGFIDKRHDAKLSDINERYKLYPFLDITVAKKSDSDTNKDFFITVGNGNDDILSENSECIHINRESFEIINKANPSKNYLVLKPKYEIDPQNKSKIKNEKSHYIYSPSKQDYPTAEPCRICGIKISSYDNLVMKAKVLYKPTKGIYDIEEKLSLIKWPYYKKRENTDNVFSNHSAAGILTFLAENLVLRGQSILDNAKNVMDAVHAATLALEAKELLNGLTPTLALQAYSLQQKAEVTAECLFAGTEYNIKLDSRFIDIENEIIYIVSQFSEKLQARTVLNTKLSIVESLSGIYSNHRQFEEELECLKESRKLSIDLVSEKKPIESILLKLIDSPLKSIKSFAVILIYIQLFYGFVYYFIHKYVNKTFSPSFEGRDIVRELSVFWQSVLSATKYFFTNDAPNFLESIFGEHEILRNIVLGSQGFLVLTSISLFMALVYQWLSRK